MVAWSTLSPIPLSHWPHKWRFFVLPFLSIPCEFAFLHQFHPYVIVHNQSSSNMQSCVRTTQAVLVFESIPSSVDKKPFSSLSRLFHSSTYQTLFHFLPYPCSLSFSHTNTHTHTHIDTFVVDTLTNQVLPTKPISRRYISPFLTKADDPCLFFF